MDGLAALAFDASTRALDKQERMLDELRARTGLLLAASSLATSFLARPAIDDAGPILLSGALLAFGISIGGCIYVLVPRPSFTFSLVGSSVYEQFYDLRDDPDEIYRRLAYDLDRFWDANDVAMQRLFVWFRRAAVALAVEVGLLIVAVSDNLL